ncbi:glycosyltransferase family 4 protein [Leptolyngbya sp. AN03gr2]|uniref:glycosyltransferase family 4 protein n=1 Tax=unclassified Leptolyngbya TaxID=2650499 RepID=UPI003D31FF34
MKPFLLVAGDFIKTGGMDRANYALADYLVRQGAEVHLVSRRVEPELQQSAIWHRVPKVANSNFLSDFLLDRVGQYWARQISQRGGRVFVNGGNCNWADVNWVHYVHAAYQPESKISLLQRAKVAVTHSHFRRTEQRNLRRAKLVIANSERTKADLVECNLAAQSKIRSIYYGIDPETFYPATIEEVRSLRQRLNLPLDCSIAVFIGALSDRRKGFDVLFEAWRHLCQDPAWNVQLFVIGQGAEVPIWKQRLSETGLVDRIQFLGFRSDVPDLLRASDCLIAPTRYEAYGLGVHEALCCGIPAIVTETAGVAERYPAALSRLLLSDGSDVFELVKAMYHWRSHQQHYQFLVQSQVAPVLRSRSWDQMAQQIVDTIGTVTEVKPVLI